MMRFHFNLVIMQELDISNLRHKFLKLQSFTELYGNWESFAQFSLSSEISESGENAENSLIR